MDKDFSLYLKRVDSSELVSIIFVPRCKYDRTGRLLTCVLEADLLLVLHRHAGLKMASPKNKEKERTANGF